MGRWYNIRFALFALSFALVTYLVIWTQHSSWAELVTLSKKYAPDRLNNYRNPYYMKDVILGLNDTLLRYDLQNKPEDYERFHEDSLAFKECLATNMTWNDQEVQIMKEMQVALESYRTNAEQVLAESHNTDGQHLASVFPKSEVLSSQLLALCDELAIVHRRAVDSSLRETQRGIQHVQDLLQIRSIVSGLMGLALAILIYRSMIAPLHAKLVQSHAIIERQEKLSALGAFAAGVAHEIRNPLTAISVRLHSLKRAVKKDDSALEDVVVIEEEINRLAGVVNDTLSFARPAEPKFNVVSAGGLLRNIQELLRPQLDQNEIQLKLEADCDAPVRVDSQQIKQVLINLVRNAAEAIDQRGTITLRAQSKTANLHGKLCPVVVLEVSDTGKGIPPEVQKRLFDPFYSTKESGTGLGLSVAAGIMDMHGGALEYTTQLNRGTTFSVILPQVISNET